MNAETARSSTRRPGRPATYVFNKPDSELSESERKLKSSIEKRRLRQNRSYHRRKALRAASEKAVADAAVSAAAENDASALRNVPSIDGVANQQSHFAMDIAASNLMSSAVPGLLSLNSAPSSSGSRSESGAYNSKLGQDKADILDAASLAARWKLPTPTPIPASALAPSGVHGLVPNPIDEIEQTIAHEVVDDVIGNDVDGTEALVQNALVAAQTATSNVVSPHIGRLRDVMEQQRDLLRMAGIKDIVFDNLRSQFLSLPLPVQSTLRHLVVFPCSFDARAATTVAGSNPFGVTDMLQSLVGSNFMIPVGKGRFQLNDTVKMFLCEDTTIGALDTSDSYHTALSRFRTYYRKQLEQFRDDNIHKVGWQREKAMLVYDSERANMQFAEFLCQRNSREMLRDFLSAGITVMRYCVNANEREAILLKALSDEEVSTHTNVLLKGERSLLRPQDDPETAAARLRDNSNKARLQLALSEAYFDQLKVKEAEQALLKALSLMGGENDIATGNEFGAASSAAGGGQQSGSTASIVDSVLVLLLLSNVRMCTNRVREARTLCVKALRILAAADLGRSTFGINAMANLTAIYLEEQHLEKASVVATRLVDTLNNMRFTKMPIFADALGVVGMVSMAQGRYHDAEQQFGSAVEIVKLWGAKEWTARPVQHCLDLDIWLLDNLASAIAKQGRSHEASLLKAQATQMRRERGLDSGGDSFDLSVGFATLPLEERMKSVPRHLY